MRRSLKSMASFLLGFLLGSVASVAFAEAVRAEPQLIPGYDLPSPDATTATS